MKYIGVILLVGFAGLALFGVFGMHADTQNHAKGCIAATVQGTHCPKQNNPLDYFAFHLNAYRSFSGAVFNSAPVSLLALLVLIVSSIRFLRRDMAAPKLYVAYKQRERFRSVHLLFQQRLIHWLAFHENSPAVL